MAPYLIGVTYEEGHGVAQDFAQALKWYKQGSARGNQFAQTSIGVMYYQGKGVQQNYAEAAKWFLKAAEKEEMNAQAYLGTMYTSGQGVRQNTAEGIKWFRLAAEQGSAKPQLVLGALYYERQAETRPGKNRRPHPHCACQEMRLIRVQDDVSASAHGIALGRDAGAS